MRTIAFKLKFFNAIDAKYAIDAQRIEVYKGHLITSTSTTSYFLRYLSVHCVYCVEVIIQLAIKNNINMENQEPTQVKCPTCRESKQVKNTQTFVLIFGGIFTFFAIYGFIVAIKDLISLF